MKSFSPERRVNRSEDPQQALSWWLEASRRRTNLGSLALADSLGILVAGAGSARDCDELAAWGPVVLTGDPWPESPPFPLSGVKVPGFDAYLCLEGRDEVHTRMAEDIAVGCSRILAGN